MYIYCRFSRMVLFLTYGVMPLGFCWQIYDVELAMTF